MKVYFEDGRLANLVLPCQQLLSVSKQLASNREAAQFM